MIWKAALVPRVIILEPKNWAAETESTTETDSNKVPGMLSANRESRLIALHHYNQKFTLTFSTQMSTRLRDSTRCLIRRIPVIMSTLDEIAFSSSQICTQVTADECLTISIGAVAGALEPCIKRFSMLGDTLMRRGINTEHLARLLNPRCPEWDAKDSTDTNRRRTQTVEWKPFSQWTKLGLPEEYSERWETLSVDFGPHDWLSPRHSSWCHGDSNLMGWDRIDAFIFDLPTPGDQFFE